MTLSLSIIISVAVGVGYAHIFDLETKVEAAFLAGGFCFLFIQILRLIL